MQEPIQDPQPLNEAPGLPWNISILTAVRDGNAMIARRVPILTSSGSDLPDARMQASVSLGLAPGVAEGRLLILKGTNGTEEMLAGKKVRPRGDTFVLTVSCKPSNPKPDFSLDGGAWSDLESCEAQQDGQELARIVQRGEPIDLAFLLDGSMAEGDFNSARVFVLKVVAALARSDPDLRLAVVLYAEYRTRVGSDHVAGWKYELDTRDFVPRRKFDRFLQEARPAGVAADDPCDALELGLQAVGKLNWQAQHRFLVLIGNSPPHPWNQQRVEYQLLDRETEQHQEINWLREMQSIDTRFGPRRISIWLDPEPNTVLSGKWPQFAQYVWKELGRDLPLAGLENEQIDSVVDFIKEGRPAKTGFDRPLDVPVVVKR